MAQETIQNTMTRASQILLLLVVFICRMDDVYGQKECDNSPMDIVMILDTSDNVDPSQIETEREFIKEIVTGIIDHDNRFALVTFGEQTLLQFRLDSYKEVDNIRMAIDYMWLSTGHGSVYNAIEYTVENGFKANEGNRLDAPDVIIVISLTSALDTHQLTEISELLQQHMIEMFILGEETLDADTFSNIHRFPTPHHDTISDDTERVMETMCKAHGLQTLWSDWSACGVTCNKGTRRRYRDCERRYPTDECYGESIEEESCFYRNCTDPVNGGWTYWNDWSHCTKTCGVGTQTRKRSCTAPTPVNDGVPCDGPAIQTQKCSDWKCPDCSLTCEEGAHLSNNCDVCECPASTLSGIIKCRSNITLSDVDVFLGSIPYRSLAKTGEDGAFEITDICFKNATVSLHKDGYLDLIGDPSQIDSLHWVLNATMETLVKPVIVKQPKSAVRLIGQDWTVCCKSEGRPKPTNVQWYKDDVQLNSTGDIMIVNSVNENDEGQYMCRVETIAGVVKSNDAYLRVVEIPDDACTRPLFRSHQLPTDCFASQYGQNVSTVDLGQCQRQKCISNDFHDNHTCGPSESTYCCDEGTTELIQINCKGFSYTMKRITSCHCQNCILKTVISGQAFGKMDNGTKVPFAYGYLLTNGKQVAVTNEMGFFRFEMPSDQDKAVVYFVDEVFKRFVPSTKVIAIQPDSATTVTIVLPLQPVPVHFDASNGITLDLGGSTDYPPAGGLSIPENSIVLDDGTPFTGQAKAYVHFMDPRNLNDLEASNGNFVYSTEDGTIAPMETFGMFHASIEDSVGRHLKVKKKMSFTLDASLFNISAGEDGDPGISLWDFDVNNGVWVEKTKMRFASATSNVGGRKLLGNVLIGDFEQQEIPQIDLTKETPVYNRVIVGYTNCDRSVPIFENRIVKYNSKPKHNACFVSVVIYEDLAYMKTAGPGTNVVAVTKEMNSPKFKGMDSKTTDDNGRVCLSVFCDSIVYIYAESKFDGSRLVASDKHDIPVWYGNSKNTKNSTEIEVRSYNLEGVLEQGKTRYGPFVEYEDLRVCKSDKADTYKFKFAYYTSNPTLTTTVNKNDYQSKLSWYPVSPDKPFSKSCFIKVAVQIGDPQVRFIARSYYYNTRKEGSYGTYDVSPLFDLSSANRTYRAACIEFRCPGLNDDKGSLSYDVKTLVDVFLPTKQTCNISYVMPSLNITQLSTSHGFRFIVNPQEDYGPKFGVYISNGRSDTVSSFCASGVDTGAVGINMKPDINPAVIYTCN